MTPDRDFILDTIDGIVVLGGDSGHAFKFAPLLGRLAADLAQGNALPPECDRFRIRAGSPVDDAWATAERVRSRGDFGPRVAQDALARLPELDRKVGSVWLVTDELALEQADRVDAAVAVGTIRGGWPG